MTGHLEKRSKSSWTVVIELGRDADGRRRRIKRAVKGPKPLAKQVLRQMLQELDSGTYVEDRGMTLEEFLHRWLEDYCRPKLAPKTFLSYSYLLEKHVLPHLGHAQIAKIRPVDLQGLYSSLLQSGRLDGKGGLSARTVQYVHAVLHKAFDCAVRWNLLARNPAAAAEPPRYRRPPVKTLDEEAVAKVLEYCDDLTGRIVRFAVLTGMRLGEILALRWDDVDWSGGRVELSRSLQKLPRREYELKETKTEKGRRNVALGRAALATLKEAKRWDAACRLQRGTEFSDMGLVFHRGDGRPLHSSVVYHRLNRAAERAGVGRIRVQDLRHTHASLLLKRGVHPKVVQERLGHSSISLTLDTYSHVAPGLQEAAARSLDGLFPVNKAQGTKRAPK